MAKLNVAQDIPSFRIPEPCTAPLVTRPLPLPPGPVGESQLNTDLYRVGQTSMSQASSTMKPTAPMNYAR